MKIFFFIFFLQIFLIILTKKTEIKFNLNSVPSLFRCKRNGRVFYFDYFPTDEQFHRTITSDCDLSLISSNKRVTFNIHKLNLQCQMRLNNLEARVTEILFFKTNCTINHLCLRLTPQAVTIITSYITKSSDPISFNIDIEGIGTETIRIGRPEQNSYSWSDDVYYKGGYRKNQIVFKLEHNKYINMMCEYTYINNPENEKAVCRVKFFFRRNSDETRTGKITSTGEGWSWLCYYYPSDAENPMDHTMISRAMDDFEKFNSTKPRALTLSRVSNLSELTNISSTSENETSNGSITLFIILLVVLISASGIFYIYKKKFQSTDLDRTRSSITSRNSVMSNEDD